MTERCLICGRIRPDTIADPTCRGGGYCEWVRTPFSAPRRGDWMQTFTGKVIWPLDPRPEEIDLVDVAHSLSNLCRFAGHTRVFYSVAQHSVLVALHAPEIARRESLLHDGTEYCLVDVPRPLKRHLPEYCAAEDRWSGAFAERFGLTALHAAAIKHHDLRALYTERRELLTAPPVPWSDAQGSASTPWPDRIEPWSPRVGFAVFLLLSEQLDLRGSRFLTAAERVLAEYWLARTLAKIPRDYDPGWSCMCGAFNGAGDRRCHDCDAMQPGARLPNDTDRPNEPERTRFDLPGDTPTPKVGGPFSLPSDTPARQAFARPQGFGLPGDGPPSKKT